MAHLTAQETIRLEQEFRLTFEKDTPVGEANAVAVSDLLKRKRLEPFLRSFAQKIGASDNAVAASMLSKRYSSLLLSGGCYALSRLGKGLDLSMRRITLVSGTGWDMFLQVETDEVSVSDSNRKAWRTETMARMIRDNLIPVFDRLSRYLPVQIMWENAATYVHFYYEKWMDETEFPEERKRLAEDFRCLTDPDNTAVTGGKPNPLGVAFRCIPHHTLPGKELRLRRTCCLYHRLPGATNCITCPSLPDRERQERCAQIVKK